MQQEARTPFEVFCHHCKVTFAVGTKQCIHCGGRLGQRGQALAMNEMLRSEEFEPGGAPPGAMDETAKTSGRSKLPISPVTLLWIVLIAGSVAQRACGGD